MKHLLRSAAFALAVTSTLVGQDLPAATLKPGSDVNIEAVSAARWMQGEVIKAFEPGKLYLFECWATWCGPCIAAIPHLNELHRKYHDKGLRIIGMNVMEDGYDKVERFVGKKSMSYPVAYTGKDSAFEKTWLKAAGLTQIPQSFIVRNGKLLLISHPANLKDSVIEALLAGDDGIQKAQAGIEEATQTRTKVTRLTAEFHQASAAGDVETMSALLTEIGKLDPASPFLDAMKLDLSLAKKDWDEIRRKLAEPSEDPAVHVPVMMMAHRISIGKAADCPADILQKVTDEFGKLMNHQQSPPNPMGRITLASLQWMIGRKDDALASARKAVEDSRRDDAVRKAPTAIFELYVKAVENGSPPAMAEFHDWINETIRPGK